MIFGKHINKFYLRYLWILLIGIASLVAVDVFQLRIPEFFGSIVDGLDPSTSTVLTKDVVTSICWDMMLVVVVMLVGRFVWRICFFGAAIRVETRLRDEMFDRCKDLSQQYYQVNKVGNLMSLFTNDLETVNECFGSGILMFFDAVILGGMAIYKMVNLNPLLTLFSMIPMFFMCASGTIIGRYMKKKWKERQESFSALSDYAQETFSGMAVVKAFVSEGKELLEFRRLNKHNENVNVAYTKASVILNIFVTLFVQSVICVILGYGGWLAYKGSFSVAELVMFISYFSSVTWPVMAVSNLIEMTSRGRASLDRISELLDTESDVKDIENLENISDICGEIEFRNLTFRYPGGEFDVLKNISLKIKPGENIGIIGKTGSGKTTLVDLLLRAYNVPDGTVYIDGHDINTIPIKQIRSAFAYVPQDNFLFSDTIKANIAFSEGGKAADERVVKAAKAAALADNVSDFPDGYNTMLGERGVTVSGGQKQRISIARALLRDSPVLILDDSVSAVDTNTEKEILDALRCDRKGKTTLLIAHRISTVESMDRVVMLDNGSIVDAGPHSELMERCAEYRKTVELQRLENEIGGVNA